jgi:outer membrane protein OmpA-like peptidoglycan-associated protein
MSVNEAMLIMNQHIKFLFSVLVFGYSFSAMADDAEKLKALERAMSVPAEGVQITKKPHTRAIVFDPSPDEPTPQKSAPLTTSEPVSHPGTVAAHTEVQISNDSCKVISPDAKVTAIDFTIEFNSGSADISPASQKLLREISKVLSMSSKCVVIEGHTDAIGRAEKNLTLSLKRAESVVDFISHKEKLDVTRLVPVGKGAEEPLKGVDPRNPHNRRVVFKIVG